MLILVNFIWIKRQRGIRQILKMVSFSPGGRTRAIQKLLESLTSVLQISMFMKALRPGVVELTKNANGHHVIQFCLKNFSRKDNEVIVSHCFVQLL